MTQAIVALVLGSAVVAAIISSSISLLLQYSSSYRQDISRRRELYAKALAACAAYREFPFAIRRRRQNDLEGERLRLSEAIRQVQQDLSFYAAWIESESVAVARAYRALLTETRRVAGGYMRDAWNAPAPSTDAEMNIEGISYAEITPLETGYLAAVREHLTPWWRRAVATMWAGLR